MPTDPVLTGYSDFEQDDARVTALAHFSDGSTARREVRVLVEREVRDVAGNVTAANAEVASTDDGSVRVGAGR